LPSNRILEKMSSIVFAVLISATIFDGVLAGAGLDQVIKQLPARRQIGVVAYSKYFMAADLANGRFWYGPLGVLAYVLTVGSAIAVYFQNVESSAMTLLFVAAAIALIHAFGTSQAAPTAFRVRGAENDETALAKIFNKFSKWTSLRGIAGVLMFIASLWALVLIV
jgi:hypothetical protein